MPPFLSCQGEAERARAENSKRAAGSENESERLEASRERTVAAEGHHGSQTNQD
jgi:hypothetical protein